MSGNLGSFREVLVLLAGGEAHRFPRKVERPVTDVPLVVWQYRRFVPHIDVAISLAHPLSAEVTEQLTSTLVFDRYLKRGPLGGMLTCCEVLDCETMFFLPVDMPLVAVTVLDALRDARQAGDEAAVAIGDGEIEPLVSLYDRRALLREGLRMLERGDVAVHRVVQRLRTRCVPIPVGQLANLNTCEDWEAVFDRPAAHASGGRG